MKNTRISNLKYAAAPLALGLALISTPSFAQTEAPAAEEAEAIVVTGSRIERKDLTGTNPVAVVSAEEFKLAGAINVDARLAGTASGLTAFLMMIAGAICSQVVGSLADGSAWPLVLCVFVTSVIYCVAGILPAWLRRRARTGMAA